MEKSKIDKLLSLGINIKVNGQEEQKVVCPKCSNDRKKSKERCLSVNVTEGIYNCFHCGWAGRITERKEVDKVYVVPELKNSTELKDKTLQWFRERGIRQPTIKRNLLTEQNEYMPQVQKKRNVICFNYYRGEQVVNQKFRDGQKNFKQVAGAEKIFYKLNDIKDEKVIIITEGEMDALSFEEAGYKNCVSVPDGAPPPNSKNNNQKFSYIENCYEYLEKVEKVFLATDSDSAGIKLRQELARRIGKEKCYIVRYPEGCKDANDVLMNLGTTQLKECLKNAQPYPIEGVKLVKEFKDEILNLYNNGHDRGATLGYESFDKTLQFKEGMFTVITGIPTHGKSNFLEQIAILLAVKYGWKFAIFSPEHYPKQVHFGRLAKILVGKPFFKGYNERMTQKQLERAMKFIGDHFYFIHPNDDEFTLDNILDITRGLVLRYGVKSLLIDPWNMLEHTDDSTAYVGSQLNKVNKFKQRYDIHIFIVAHTTKMYKQQGKTQLDVPNLYSISGSSNWYNKSDNGITVYRNFERDDVEVYVQKVKFEHLGNIGYTIFKFNKMNARYYEENSSPNDDEYEFDKETSVQSEMFKDTKQTSIQPPMDNGETEQKKAWFDFD